MDPICTIMHYLFPLFIYLSWKEKSFVDFESVGIKYALLVYLELENLKTWNMRCFYKMLWDLKWRVEKEQYFTQQKSVNLKMPLLQEIFLVHLYNMYSKYRVIFTSYTEESISLAYSYPFLMCIYIHIILSAVIRVQNIEI